MIKLDLPYPPSVNRYWRHPNKGRLAGRHMVSPQGRDYRSKVAWIVHMQCRSNGSLSGRLEVTMSVQPPDRRKRDIDNILKALLDACTYGGLWHDDSQIDRMSVMRMPPCRGGSVSMTVREIETV